MENSKRGQAPYGFRWRGGLLLPEKIEVETRCLAFELFLQLKSKGAVARELNKAGRFTRKGGKWSDVQIDRILTCSSAIGQYESQRSEIGPSGKRVLTKSEHRIKVECDMIVTRPIWEKVQSVLRENSKAPEKLESLNLFTGVVWCHCGLKMKTVSDGAKLDCPKCHAKIPVTDLENIFVEDFFDLIANCPSLTAAMGSPSTFRGLQAEVVDITIALGNARKQRAGVEAMLSSSSISLQRFEELHGPLEQEVRKLEFHLTRVQKQLAGHTPSICSLPEWKTLWAGWPVKRQRQLLTTFVEKVTVQTDAVEIAYLLSDSSSKEATQPQQITPPTNHPQIVTNPSGTQYIRLPKPGEKCPITGLSRSKMNELILPNERNHFNPPVASKSLRNAGAHKGTRLVLLESLLAYLAGKI